MSAIFFWVGKNYRTDAKEGGLDYSLNQNNSLIDEVEIGQHIFAFTRRLDGRYVLAADLVVAGKKKNAPNDDGYKYGEYHVQGNKQSSIYFNTLVGPDIEPLLRGIFPPNEHSKQKDFRIGLSFQGKNGVKLLTPDAEQKLIDFSKKCARLP